MPKPPRYLKQLEHELLALGDDAMLLEELDGFIAGLLVCPELIKPSEWLPVVWGSEGEDDPAFDSLDHLNRVLGLVMEHCNDVCRLAIRTCGGQSMLKSLPLERHYRDSRCGSLMLPWTAEICMDRLGHGALYRKGETDE